MTRSGMPLRTRLWSLPMASNYDVRSMELFGLPRVTGATPRSCLTAKVPLATSPRRGRSASVPPMISLDAAVAQLATELGELL